MRREPLRNRQRPISDGITISDVGHGFDGIDVLEDVTLSLGRGETVAVIGPSGTGKTTLLRLLSLFSEPDAGTIEMDGRDPWTLSERDRLELRRRMGMVFQEAALFDATVRRNVSYGLTVRRGWRHRLTRWLSRSRGNGDEETVGDTQGTVRDAQEAVRDAQEAVWDAQGTGTDMQDPVTEALRVVGLADAEARRAGSLSGGEAQRVAFARALAYDPEFLLLDEPTSDLDPRNTAVIEDAIDTARSRGLGVVVATHDMHQAERVADRVAVMIDGRLIEVGPTDRVFASPNDPRARKFIDGELVY